MTKRVLMLGWEFPPAYTGGLGIACQGIAKGLSKLGVKVTIIIPTAPTEFENPYANVIIADKYDNIKLAKIPSLLTPYISFLGYQERYERFIKSRQKHQIVLYGKTLIEEVELFKHRVLALYNLGLLPDFEVIHAHDWMTFPAAIALKKVSKKPLVVHIHSTEHDRSAGQGYNPEVFTIEKQGIVEADRVICVSGYTKSLVLRLYKPKPEKIVVVHNAFDMPYNNVSVKKHHKVVLFLGRLTMHKGPDYFIRAAKRVLEYIPDVRFVIAGSGEMEPYLIELAADLGISSKVLFAGFLKGEDVAKAYKMADVYVLSSVSEPFGITPLEALSMETPVIISKQSGISEVLRNTIKVDFWDIEKLAQSIIALLKYKTLHQTLKEHGSLEVKNFDWLKPAKKLLNIYQELN